MVDSNESSVVGGYNLSSLVKHFSDQMSGANADGKPVPTASDIKAGSNLFVRIEFSSVGKITRIKLLPKNSSVEALDGAEYDSSSNSVGNILFDDKTVVFVLNSSENGAITPDAIEVGEAAELLENGAVYKIVGFDENIIYGLAVVTD